MILISKRMPPKIVVNRFSRANINIPKLSDMTKPNLQQQPESKPELKFNSVLNRPIEDTVKNDIPNSDPDNLDSDDDFELLQNDKFVSESVKAKTEKEQEAEQKKIDAQQKREETQRKKLAKAEADAQKAREKEMKEAERKEEKAEKKARDDLFSEAGTELYGKDRLQLIKKIEQYKILFADNEQLQKLKIKKKASIEELHEYLAECEAIVDTDTIETFMTDAILQTISMVELASTRTRYNISGLSKMLSQNIQFNSLCKQLYLKYKVFSQIPLEAQMMMLIMTTTWVCLEKNKAIANDQAFGNKTVDPNLFN